MVNERGEAEREVGWAEGRGGAPEEAASSRLETVRVAPTSNQPLAALCSPM